MDESARARRAAAECAIFMEEGVARVSHELRNQLAAMRNAMFYLRRRFEPSQTWEADPRIAKFVGMIEQLLVDAAATVASGAVSREVYSPERERTPLSPLIEAAIAAFGESPWAVPVEAKIEAGDGSVDEAQFTLAIARLLDATARQTAARHLTLDAGPRGEDYRVVVTAAAVEVPNAKAQPGIDLSWAIVRRAAMLQKAELERAQAGDSLSVAFTVRDPGSDEAGQHVRA